MGGVKHSYYIAMLPALTHRQQNEPKLTIADTIVNTIKHLEEDNSRGYEHASVIGPVANSTQLNTLIMRIILLTTGISLELSGQKLI